jgi:hypothetical protein
MDLYWPGPGFSPSLSRRFACGIENATDIAIFTRKINIIGWVILALIGHAFLYSKGSYSGIMLVWLLPTVIYPLVVSYKIELYAELNLCFMIHSGPMSLSLIVFSKVFLPEPSCADPVADPSAAY